MEDQLEQHQKWWLKNKRLLMSATITIITILIAFVLLVYWFGWDWTGFNSGESKITITSTSQGITTTTEIQPAKSLWDRLQLIGLLAIPIVVGLGTVWFTSRQTQVSEANRTQQSKESEANREREQETAIKIAADNQHEAAFRAYLEKMSELLIERGLAKPTPGDLLPKIARIQTLAVLLGLDSIRKGSVLQFLYESGLIHKDALLIRPSKKNITVFLDKVGKIIEDNKQATAGNLIVQLVLIIQGWARYHQHVASKRTFKKVDHLIFCMLWRWAKRRHPKKGAKWVKAKYYHSRGNRDWGFYGETTDNKGTHQVQLPLTFQTRIKRHVKVREKANPYDPEWEIYFEKRLDLKMDNNLKHCKKLLYLWQEQKGLCPICHQKITKMTGWHSHHIIWKSKGGSDNMENRVLLLHRTYSYVMTSTLFVVPGSSPDASSPEGFWSDSKSPGRFPCRVGRQ